MTIKANEASMIDRVRETMIRDRERQITRMVADNSPRELAETIMRLRIQLEFAREDADTLRDRWQNP